MGYKTSVVIIGAGPAGLLLGQLLYKKGIEHIILERRSREYVKSRIRAGVLETGTIDSLTEAGVGTNVRGEGLHMEGFSLCWGEESCRIDFTEIGKYATVYGQTRVTEDLMFARESWGGNDFYEAENVELHELTNAKSRVTFDYEGKSYSYECDFIAGCDGYHGASRPSIPREHLVEYERTFPFGWLGILADVTPVSPEVHWINQSTGFLMCSLRSPTRARYYIQVPKDERLNDWDADRFWEEYHKLLPQHLKGNLETGPALEMSITPLHSYVCETMQFGNLYLVGDAAHIVPPTGAKGLNLAIADATLLANALAAFYHEGQSEKLQNYPRAALGRIWKAVRFSWWMTMLTHQVSSDPMERKIQLGELMYTKNSQVARMAIAENFCGL